MQSFYAKFYEKVGEEKFKLISIFFCIFGDVLVASYIYGRLNNYPVFVEIMKKMIATRDPSFDVGTIPANIMAEQFQLIINVSLTMLASAVLFHLVMYAFYYANKSFARGYFKLLIWVGSVSFFFAGISLISDNPLASIGFIVQSFFYSYNIMGIRYFA